MKRIILLAVKVSVLAVLVALAVATQDLREIWTLVAKGDFTFLLPFLVLNIIAVALASTNLFLLLRPLGKELRWRKIFYFDALSLAGSYYTPGGMGGVGVMFYMMRREGVGLKDSTVVLLVDKGITLIVALLFTAAYLGFYYGGGFGIDWPKLAVFGAVVTLAAMTALKLQRVREPLEKIIARIGCYWGQYGVLSANLLITVGIFTLSAAQFIVAFYAIGIEAIDWRMVLASYGVLLLLNYMPITFGGIGLGEASAVFLWSGLGLTSEQIIAVFLLSRMFTLLATMVIGGTAMFAWLYRRQETDGLE